MAVESRPLGRRRSWPSPPRGMRPGSDLPRLRILWLIAIALLLATTVWGRLAYWQVLEHGQLSAMAADQHLTEVPLPATRGMIFDRDMRPLAINTTVYDVTLAPDLVKPAERDRVAGALSAVLGVPHDDVVAKLSANTKFAYVAKRQAKERADQLRQLKLPGVYLQAQEQRTYLPGGTSDASLASSLLGFVDYQGRGQRGVEAYYDPRLAGRDGYVNTYRDLAGRELLLSGETRRDPVNGANLVLTLDSNVQFSAEQAIAAGVKAARAESGSVLVMDSKTGGVVAWASYPGYDGNQFATTDPSRTRDPIVSNLYEPGSVMKVVTLSGALDAGKITPDTTIQDPGYVNVAGTVIHDWDNASHGTVTMTNVLEKSLNVGAIKAMQMEGRDNFFHYLQAFGFGSSTGIDVAAEAQMQLRSAGQWRDTDVATTAFGQGIAVNMVQMCAAINVVANQGRWVQPHVVESIGGASPGKFATRQAVTPQTAASMTQMMESVVQHGSGHMARVKGFELNEAGKTGTSQIPENGKYSPDQVWASYVGFLPADNPRFTMLVVVQKPNNGSADHNEGYYVSGPIWKAIAEQIIPEWRITPTP
ncbi:penicillin-binding protein 2 [Candidatus Nephthysia bennettiae]|uniref:Penicillin-binding protein 2 n=1 Tax=Candidatus Nephthysia bennettiae TaxID=3127016 RepID=A0A934NBS8_9BACT|nr:penicillin-binding protein 2 [Candidatus Dormibacteraeota bacterium]MBJ7611364.1 penicillin-binding protein 2 [Candidatus Dormibacteraeota bacterium]